MTFELSPAGLVLDEDYQTYLLKYRPQCLPAALWDRVRPDVLDLVARSDPSFRKEISMLAGALCRLLAEFAGEVDEPSVATLLNRSNVDALLVRLQLAGMPDGTRGQHQVRLRRLLRTHEGTPKPEALPRRQSRALVPYSDAEVEVLIGCLDRCPDPVRLAGLDVLLLGLGHGIVVPHTDEVTSPAPGQLVWNGRVLGEVHKHWGPVLQAHRPASNVPGRKDWEGLRAYLAWQHPEVELTTQRLRDTWLQFSAGPTAGLIPVAVLMADRVGRERLMHAARESVDDLSSWTPRLRDF